MIDQKLDTARSILGEPIAFDKCFNCNTGPTRVWPVAYIDGEMVGLCLECMIHRDAERVQP